MRLTSKKWIGKACDGCKAYNQECKKGVCGLYPYIRKKPFHGMQLNNG